MKTETLVTIVIPVYNVERYIGKCIESLQQQTYSNIEIILVNDGTKDNSLNIAQEFANADKRIKIISQENQGLSAARNTGIKNATGEYICFVDSDDFVDKDYINLLLESCIKSNADISVCDFYYIDENNHVWNRIKKEERIFSNIEALKDIFSGSQITEVMTWNKLYKLSLFRDNNIWFPTGKLHEDNFTTYKLYYYANHVALITDKLYYYLQRSNSIMGKKFNTKRLDIIQAVEETKSFFKDKPIEMPQELEYYEMSTKINLLNNMIRDEFDGIEKDNIIQKIIDKKHQYQKNRYTGIKMKIVLFLIRGKGKIYTTALAILDCITRKKRKK